VIRSQVIKLDPTYKQEEFFRQCVGTARFSFNWALKRWRDQFTADQKPNEGKLRKELNAVKEHEFPWMLELPCGVVKQAVKNLGTAYQNFFDSLKGKRAGAKMKPPDFKSRHKSKQSARLDNGPGTFSFEGKTVKLSKIGTVKTHEALRFEGRPLSAVVSFVGGRWWLSVQVELPDVVPEHDNRPSVGIDLGLTTALTLSTGEKIESPRPLKSALERLKRLGRFVSRKVKGSKNRKKAAQKLARVHWRVGQIRKDWQHKTTTSIAKRFSLVCVEDLNVKGMMANHSLAKAISDIGWSEIGRQLKYKCAAVQEVGRFYPSSKTCAGCGQKTDSMPLNVRSWACPECGEIHDRDVNAAVNIENEGRRLYTASCAVINACGDGSSGYRALMSPITKLPSVKQELGRTLQMSTN
jgi:putative transposase